MHEVMIRFKLVRLNRIIEVSLDRRLSFSENLRYLEELEDLKLEGSEIYDPYKKVFLDRDLPLERFEIGYFITLHLLS